MSHDQFSLFEPPAFTGPPGFDHRRELLGAAEEALLAERIAGLPLRAFEFQGFTGKRRVHSFGWRYDFNRAVFEAAAPIPEWLQPLRAAAADFAQVSADALEQALVTEYGPGAGIGWHRDRPVFDRVVGVSLLSACVLRFRRRGPGGFDRVSIPLSPRSAYALSGEARSEWEHSIPAVDALRYSITFRSLRQAGAKPTKVRMAP